MLELPEDLAADLQGLAETDTATLLASFGVNFSALPERITRVVIDVGWTYSSLMGNLQEQSNTLMLGFEASPFNWRGSLVERDEYGPRMRCGETTPWDRGLVRMRSGFSVKEQYRPILAIIEEDLAERCVRRRGRGWELREFKCERSRLGLHMRCLLYSVC